MRRLPYELQATKLAQIEFVASVTREGFNMP